MAFNATSVTLEEDYKLLRQRILQHKQNMQYAATLLAGNFRLDDAHNLKKNLEIIIPEIDAIVAKPGLADYCISVGASVDGFNEMRNAMGDVLTWLTNNLPQMPTYAPATTAPLLSLVQASAATII